MEDNVSALFVRKDSIYKSLLSDCWDIDRDARNFIGKNPVVVHPPCRAWSRLRMFAKPREDEKELAYFAVDLVRQNGGVLEHPSGSFLWSECELPLDGSVDSFGGYTISVDQFWFGHRAQKKTLLYICKVDKKDIPPLPLRFEPITHVVSGGARKGSLSFRPSITKVEREETPLLFAKWLLQLANNVKKF